MQTLQSGSSERLCSFQACTSLALHLKRHWGTWLSFPLWKARSMAQAIRAEWPEVGIKDPHLATQATAAFFLHLGSMGFGLGSLHTERAKGQAHLSTLLHLMKGLSMVLMKCYWANICIYSIWPAYYYFKKNLQDLECRELFLALCSAPLVMSGQNINVLNYFDIEFVERGFVFNVNWKYFYISENKPQKSFIPSFLFWGGGRVGRGGGGY